MEPSAATDSAQNAEVLQVRYRDADNSLHTLDVDEMITVLNGLRELSNATLPSRFKGHVLTNALAVRPPKEGSFALELLVTPEAFDTVTAAGSYFSAEATSFAVGLGLQKLADRLAPVFDRKKRKIEASKVTEEGMSVAVVEGHGWVKMPTETLAMVKDNPHKLNRIIRKILDPLAHEATELEIRVADPNATTEEILRTPPLATFTREDLHAVEAELQASLETVDTFETLAVFTKVDRKDPSHWKIEAEGQKRSVTMADREFLYLINEGEKISLKSRYRVKIEETRTVKGGRTNTSWAVVEVMEPDTSG